MLELRRYQEGDAAAVWRLHIDGLHQMGVDAGDGPWDDDLRSVAETYLAGGGEFLVGALAGEVVATGALRLDTTVKQLPSRLLYRSEGFAEVERTLDHPGETTIVFEKPL